MSELILFPLIFTASFVLTMVGLGGGLIFAPLFVLLQYPVGEAVAASLFLNGIAALSAAINYVRRRMVDLHIGLPLIVSSTISAPLGAYTTTQVDLRIFTAVLAAVILLAAVRMFFSKKMESKPVTVSASRKIIGGGIIGMLIGYTGGMLGIGGGVFIVPLLIYVLNVPTKTAAATSIFIVVFSSFSGFLAHVTIAAPDWQFILLAAVFSFAGGQLGSRIMMAKLNDATIRRIFACVLLIIVFKLIQRIIA